MGVFVAIFCTFSVAVTIVTTLDRATRPSYNGFEYKRSLLWSLPRLLLHFCRTLWTTIPATFKIKFIHSIVSWFFIISRFSFTFLFSLRTQSIVYVLLEIKLFLNCFHSLFLLLVPDLTRRLWNVGVWVLMYLSDHWKADQLGHR